VKKTAEIARLELSEAEIERMGDELEKILEHFAAIKDVKSDEEMYYVNELANPLRDDVSKEKDGAEIRKQFTSTNKGYLVAPKLIK